MKITRYIKNVSMLTCAGLMFTACDDFLDLEPMNEIVKENYWTEEADVQSVVYACYSGLESADCVKRMQIWGEMRSDNISASSSTPYDLQQILNENILETNGWMTWQSFYQVINRCNTVIHFAPSVAEKDPNFTDSELKATIAEVTALRALAYFYLVRTFRDVPYITTPSLDDDDIDGDYRVAPTPFKDIISALISDLENVKNDALRLYPDEGGQIGESANTSRVTTCFISALLADLYLWQNDYKNCIRYCDAVVDYKMQRYEEMLQDEPDYMEVELFGNQQYPLIPEQPSGNTLGNTYNSIFGTGNSFESIFELYYLNNQTETNSMVSDYYGSTSNSLGNLSASTLLATGVYEKTNEVFTPTDCRFAEDIQTSGSYYAIRKYVFQSCNYTMGKNGAEPTYTTRQIRSNNYANWIIYRLTDVMLMKAEAEVELCAENATDSLLRDAFNIVSVVYNRGNNLSTASADSLSMSNYATVASMRQLVLLERQRELLFEGKRWFDLVRFSLRQKDNTALIESVIRKHKQNTSAIRIKLNSQDALFFPYPEKELDANPHLTQNPAYITNESSSK